jgi:hypothetical protein
MTTDQFDAIRKLAALESDEASGVFRDAFELLRPGEQLNWLDVAGEPEQARVEPAGVEVAVLPRRRGRPGKVAAPPPVEEAVTGPDDLDDFMPA